MLFVFALSSQAQDRKSAIRTHAKRSFDQQTPEQRADRMTKRMTAQLSLTKEQQEKIHKLSLDQAERAAEQAKLAKEKAKAMEIERIKVREEMEEILSPEQQAKWKEARSKRSKFSKTRSHSRRKDMERRSSMRKKADSISTKKSQREITPIMNAGKE